MTPTTDSSTAAQTVAKTASIVPYLPDRSLCIVFYVESVPFTREVVEGRTSLGGSESACLGLAKALAARGHDVHIFATRLSDDAVGDHDRVAWHHAEELPSTLQCIEPDVFCSLRMPGVFGLRQRAKWVQLWNQDLLINSCLGGLSQVDELVYVSQFHRQQWEERDAPLASMRSWVTTNGVDCKLALRSLQLPWRVGEAPIFLHTSRPERGHDALLVLWPKIRQQYPDAVLRVCRYDSMYDAAGWGQVCESYDRRMARMASEVGGVEFLGQLSKAQLYRELSKAALLLYPVSQRGFAETNCIAVTEAQACGVPVVASWSGALPETLAEEAGLLIDGDPMTEPVQQAFLAAIGRALTDRAWRAQAVKAGLEKARTADFGELAKQWEAHYWERFAERRAQYGVQILRKFLHDDNHAAAARLSQELFDAEAEADPLWAFKTPEQYTPVMREACEARGLCERVIAQEDLDAEDYAKYAVSTTQDVEANQRFRKVVADLKARFTNRAPSSILDVACGNGALAVLLARAFPEATITAVDYSEAGIDQAVRAVQKLYPEEAKRIVFLCRDWTQLGDDDDGALPSGDYDLVTCCEFLEHVAEPWELVDLLDSLLAPGGLVLYTCPSGPFFELLDPGIPRHRGHVHTFSARDIVHLFGSKPQSGWEYFHLGHTVRGTPVGHWFITHGHGSTPAAPSSPIDYTRQILVERPHVRVVGSMIVRDGGNWLRPCLGALRCLDAVVVYDTGSTDGSQALARSMGAEVIEGLWPGDFSSARNLALDAAVQRHDPDWVLWVDADEVLDGGLRLYEFATAEGTGPFNGISFPQTHLHLDVPTYSDKPVRLFRARRGIRFYGLVHEQPASDPADVDAGINPTLYTELLKLAHYGYHTKDLRTAKMLERNLPLLDRETRQTAFHRRLTWVLAMRDQVNLADVAHQAGDRAMAANRLRLCVHLYDKYQFADPADRYHELAWSYYQNALERGRAWGVFSGLVSARWAFLATLEPEAPNVRPEPFLARSLEEVQAFTAAKTAHWLDGLRQPAIRTAPYSGLERRPYNPD